MSSRLTAPKLGSSIFTNSMILSGSCLPCLVVAVDAERHAVHAAEVLHQEGLALHHAQAARRRAVAVAEHARRVGDDGHQVAAVGQLERRVVVVADGRRDGRHARRVPDVEPVEAVDAGLRDRHHLPAVEPVGLQGQFLEERGLGLGQLLLREGGGNSSFRFASDRSIVFIVVSRMRSPGGRGMTRRRIAHPASPSHVADRRAVRCIRRTRRSAAPHANRAGVLAAARRHLADDGGRGPLRGGHHRAGSPTRHATSPPTAWRSPSPSWPRRRSS